MNLIGTTEALILVILEEVGRDYGYSVANRLKHRLGGGAAASHKGINLALRRMAVAGLVRYSPNGDVPPAEFRRQYYEPTDEGRQALEKLRSVMAKK